MHIKLIAAVIFLMTSASIQADSAHDIDLADSIIWQISGPGIEHPSYLAGTIHLICEKDFTLDKRMVSAISHAKQIYLELDMDDQSEMAAVMAGMVSKKSLKERLSTAQYKQLSDLVEKYTDFSINLFDKTELFGISSMLTMAAMDCPIKTVDIELMTLAQKSNLPVYGLEAAAEQIALFEILSPKKSDDPWSDEEMAAFGLLPELIDQLVQLYNDQDVSAMYDMTRDMMLEAENGEIMLQALLDKRNMNWVEKMPGIVKESPTFFAVGAGHLGGTNGVINLLRQKGLTVEPATL